MKAIRWRQRFENLRRAYSLFDEGVKAESLNRLEKEGVIQRFEYTFELSWKTMKDYLESQGVTASYPREVLKEAFAHALVADGDVWMEMLERRNMLAHTYDEKTFETAFALACGSFHEAISNFVGRLEKEQ
jgi:nucleotidyltransferase substrate binding protein (TIGR01987 family)